MPKPILKMPNQTQQSQMANHQTQAASLLSAVRQEESIEEQERRQKEKLQQDKMLLDRLLRKPRSKAYMEAIARLDAGGHVHNQAKVEEIIQAILQEFPEVNLSGMLVGIVSICYLGDPYEVHSLSLEGNILEHYQRGQTMPGRLEKARGIALRGGYQFIEVYYDCCRAVSGNGSVAVIMG